MKRGEKSSNEKTGNIEGAHNRCRCQDHDSGLAYICAAGYAGGTTRDANSWPHKDQEGLVEFRYALRAHGGYDPAAATRFAVGLSQPLLIAAASSAPAKRRLPEIEPPEVIAVSSKPSEHGRALILQLFAASGQDHVVRLRGAAVEEDDVWLSDFSEKPIKRARSAVSDQWLGFDIRPHPL
jgi:hypothetical protein